jgi:hypothetical protein
MFAEEYRSLPLRCLIGVSYGLTHKHAARLERLARDKYSTYCGLLINYACKKFHQIGHLSTYQED